MNYEIAAEHGIVNNEEMKDNKKLKNLSKFKKNKIKIRGISKRNIPNFILKRLADKTSPCHHLIMLKI